MSCMRPRGSALSVVLLAAQPQQNGEEADPEEEQEGRKEVVEGPAGLYSSPYGPTARSCG